MTIAKRRGLWFGGAACLASALLTASCGARPGSSGLALRRPGPADAVPVRESSVRVIDGRPVLMINGEPTYYASHYLRNYKVKLRSRWPEGIRKSVREFAARGVHRFEAHISPGWKGVDEFDPAYARNRYPVDRLMEAVLAADSKAQIVFRIGGVGGGRSTRFLTKEFMAKYPDELEADHTGKKYYASFGSDICFEAIAKALARIVAHIESRPWAGHVVGYNLFLEFEGVPWGSLAKEAFTDYSPAMRRTWRAFLKKRYGTDAALCEAWGDPKARIATATVPSPEEHLGGDERLVFHHPLRGRKVRDYYELMDELTIRRHRQVAQAVKKACGGRKIVGLMGGYSQDAGQPRSVISKTGTSKLELHKQHFSGPGCWGRVFEIPEIDFFFAPTDYLNTGTGGVCLLLNMPASQKLHGKLTWVEEDQRTHLHKHWMFNPMLADARESVMAHRRNAALLYTEAGLSDWMEQVANWLLHPKILENLSRIDTLLQGSVTAPGGEPDAICVLIDEESQGWTKPVTRLDEVLFFHQRNKGLSYCGVPVRYHLLSDLAHENFPKYKTFILPNAYHWTPAKEKLLAEKVRRDGNVIVWLYGAGYVGDKDLSTAGMRRATGIGIAASPHPWEHRISIRNYTHPITRNLPGDLSFGTSRHYGPIFRVEDPDAVILGRSFGNVMSHHPALAIKEFGKGARGAGAGAGKRGKGDYASIYCEAPDLPASLLREIARYAGSHVYLDTNDFLLAGKDIVMIHSAKPGRRTLRLPHKADVTDVFTGKVHARSAREFTFEFKAPGTFVFRLSPGRR